MGEKSLTVFTKIIIDIKSTRRGNSWSRMDSRCTQRVLTGAALGGAVGGAVGACYGTYEAFAYKVRVFVNSRVSMSSLSPFSLCSRADALYIRSSPLSLIFSRIYTDTGNAESPTHRTHDHGKCRTVFAVFRRREFVALREEILMRRRKGSKRDVKKNEKNKYYLYRIRERDDDDDD